MKKKNLLTRVIIIAIVTVVGIYLVIGPRRRPTPQDFTWSGIKQTLKSISISDLTCKAVRIW